MVTVNQARTRTPAEVLAEVAERAARLHTVGLRPDDTVRMLRPGRVRAWWTGNPHDVTAEGSVTCILDTQFRTVPPERLEVKRKGPRGGVLWQPLVEED